MKLLDFRPLGKNKPNITARFNLPPNMRIYVHGDGFSSSYAAREHVTEVFNNLRLWEESDFFIVIPWVDGAYRMIDFFSYSLESFPQNEESPSIYTKEGIIIKNGHCCLDGRLICGAEEFYRRMDKNKEEYVNIPPRLKGLNLKVDE